MNARVRYMTHANQIRKKGEIVSIYFWYRIKINKFKYDSTIIEIGNGERFLACNFLVVIEGFNYHDGSETIALIYRKFKVGFNLEVGSAVENIGQWSKDWTSNLNE